jgi:hypothetical protein
MKRARVVAHAAVCVCLSTAACSSSIDATAEHALSASQLLIAAAAYSPSCPQPGTVLVPGPSVIVTDRQGRPAPNVEVTFRAARGDQLSHAVAWTDALGVASTGSWHLSDTLGTNVIVAAVLGGPATTIQTTTEIGSSIVAAFDLVSVGGQPIPDHARNGDVLTGGHLYLAENHTSRRTFELNGHTDPLPTAVCGFGMPYVVGASQIDLYAGQIVSSPNGPTPQLGEHFATATVRGDTLAVTYDSGEYADEVYVLRIGRMPLIGF